jgi:hypothetical protein
MTREYLKELYYLFLFGCMTVAVAAHLDIPRDIASSGEYATPDPEGWQVLASASDRTRSGDNLLYLGETQDVYLLKFYKPQNDAPFHIGVIRARDTHDADHF